MATRVASRTGQWWFLGVAKCSIRIGGCDQHSMYDHGCVKISTFAMFGAVPVVCLEDVGGLTCRDMTNSHVAKKHWSSYLGQDRQTNPNACGWIQAPSKPRAMKEMTELCAKQPNMPNHCRPFLKRWNVALPIDGSRAVDMIVIAMVWFWTSFKTHLVHLKVLVGLIDDHWLCKIWHGEHFLSSWQEKTLVSFWGTAWQMLFMFMLLTKLDTLNNKPISWEALSSEKGRFRLNLYLPGRAASFFKRLGTCSWVVVRPLSKNLSFTTCHNYFTTATIGCQDHVLCF